MRLRTALRIGLVLIGITSSAKQMPPIPVADPIHIEGIIVDGITGLPLAGAQLTILAGKSVKTISDNDGRFSIEFGSIPCSPSVCIDSPYIITVFRDGYMPGRPEGRKIPHNSNIPVTLKAGGHLDDLVIHLYPAAVVTGRVMDPSAHPVANARVLAFRFGYNKAGIRHRLDHDEAETNDLGEFRFYNFEPGDWLFEVRPPRTDWGQIGSFLSSVYFPGTTDLNHAEVFHVANDSSVSLPTITLLPVHGGILRVHTANGAGVTPDESTEFEVDRFGEAETPRQNPAPLVWIFGDVNVPNGKALGRFPAGTYDIYAFSRILPPPNSVNPAALGTAVGKATITMAESDVDVEIKMHVAPEQTIQGSVLARINGDSELRPIAGVSFRLDDFAEIAIPNSRSGTSGPDGLFSVPILQPSTYRVHTTKIPAGLAVISIRDGDRDVLKDGLVVPEGKVPNLSVIVSDAAGEIGGFILDSAGKKVASGVVAVIPDDPVHRSLRTGDSTDMFGAFRFQVPPGDYHMFAWRELEGGAFYDPKFIDPLFEKGTAVHVDEHGHINLNLKILD